MEQFQQQVYIGSEERLLTLEKRIYGDDIMYLVHGYGPTQTMGQNEDGGFEFVNYVPEELAMAEDEISVAIEEHERRAA